MRSARTRILFLWILIHLLWTGPARAAGAGRLDRDVMPVFQRVELILDAREPDYSGIVSVDLRVRKAVDSFRFHAAEMDLRSIHLTRPGETISLEASTGADGLVRVSGLLPIEQGEYTLRIEFSNDFGTRATGLYRLDVEGEGYAFTQFEATDARYAFPCWDEPSFKIPWQVTLKVPPGHEAISNTLIERDARGGTWRTVTFEKTPPLPSYLIAIATGPLERVPIPGLTVPGHVITVKGQSGMAAEAVRITPPILAALEGYFGRPYPFTKLDLIAVPEFWPGAMENPGAVTFADRLLLIDPGAAGVAEKRNLASITAHELAHMWFGDLVTMEWWDDLWLNESFATWMGHKITEQVYPGYQIGIAGVRQAHSAMRTDARITSRAIRRPVGALDNLLQSADILAYQKGRAVLGMFEAWLGSDTFRKGVLAYLKRHAWGNAQGSDLWNALASVSVRDVAGAMSTFLDQAGVPMVRVESLSGGKIRLFQERFLNHGVSAPGPVRWSIPVRLRYPDGEGIRTRTVLLERASITVDLGTGKSPAWVHPNADERGYYRWQIPPESLKAIVSRASRVLTPRERIGLLENLAALLDAGTMDAGEYLRLLSRLAKDPHPEVSRTVMRGLAGVKEPFMTPELAEDFGIFVRRTLRPILNRIGMEPAEGEEAAVAILRPELIGWLGDEGQDRRLRKQATEMARRYIQDPTDLDPTLAGTVLSLSAIEGDDALFEIYRKRLETTRVPAERGRMLTALGSFRSPALQEKALRYALEGPLRPQEIGRIASAMKDHPGSRDRVFAWLQQNYRTIMERIPPIYTLFAPHYAGGCSEERAAEARTFFGKPENRLAGTEREVAKMSEAVAECVKLRERERTSVAAFLEEVKATRRVIPAPATPGSPDTGGP